MNKGAVQQITRRLSRLHICVMEWLKENLVIHKFQQGCRHEITLPMYFPNRHKILIIRLDSTSDYLLWRNSLSIYKLSQNWGNLHITMLGNKAWKEIFDYADTASVDEVIWIDTDKYSGYAYRRKVWERLRTEGFDTVICPSRKRMPLLDDACALATGAEKMFACSNIYFSSYGNGMSDNLYQYIYQCSHPKHDFLFNQEFANWCCNTSFTLKRPSIDGFLFQQPADSDYIICYIGADCKRKRIPVKTWIELLTLLRRHYSSNILLTGEPEDLAVAEQIRQAVPVDSLVGKLSQQQMINYTAFANVVITGDAFAAHLAASCQTPVLIVSNGADSIRFSDYKEAGMRYVETVYTEVFLQEREKRKADELRLEYVALKNDILTVRAHDILKALDNIFPVAIMNVLTEV